MILSTPISSKHNPHFRRWQNLLESRGIKERRQFFLFGDKVVNETLFQHPEACLEVLHFEDEDLNRLALTPKNNVSKYRLTKELFRELDIFGTQSTLLVCELPEIQTWQPQEKINGLTVLCPLGDPSNVGALLRSCYAFNVAKFVILKESASPFHPRATRAASGAALQVPLAFGPSVNDLREVQGIALDMSGTPLTKFEWPPSSVLLVGEEGPGLPMLENWQKVAIPMREQNFSLNSTVAASIALYAFNARKTH